MLFGRLSGVSALVIEPLVTMLKPESYVVYQLFDDPVFGVVAVRRSLLAQVPLEVLLEAAREQLEPVIGTEGYWAGSVTVRPAEDESSETPLPASRENSPRHRPARFPDRPDAPPTQGLRAGPPPLAGRHWASCEPA